ATTSTSVCASNVRTPNTIELRLRRPFSRLRNSPSTKSPFASKTPGRPGVTRLASAGASGWQMMRATLTVLKDRSFSRPATRSEAPEACSTRPATNDPFRKTIPGGVLSAGPGQGFDRGTGLDGNRWLDGTLVLAMDALLQNKRATAPPLVLTVSMRRS